MRSSPSASVPDPFRVTGVPTATDCGAPAFATGTWLVGSESGRGVQLLIETVKGWRSLFVSIMAPSSEPLSEMVCAWPAFTRVSRHSSVPRCHSTIRTRPVTTRTVHPSAQAPMYG